MAGQTLWFLIGTTKIQDFRDTQRYGIREHLKCARVFILAGPNAVFILPDSGGLFRLNTAVAAAGSASPWTVVFSDASILRCTLSRAGKNGDRAQQQPRCDSSSCRPVLDNFVPRLSRDSARMRRWVSPCLYSFYSAKSMKTQVLARPPSVTATCASSLPLPSLAFDVKMPDNLYCSRVDHQKSRGQAIVRRA